MRKQLPKKYESSEHYLMHFFVQVLLLVQDAPESILDELEKAIHLARQHRKETQERLEEMQKRKNGTELALRKSELVRKTNHTQTVYHQKESEKIDGKL